MTNLFLRLLFIPCGISGLLSATTAITVTTPTSTQAVLRIKTDQTGSCSFKLSTVNDFSGAYAPAHDVDTSLFSNSDQCSREGNINGVAYKTLVLGKRAAELAMDGKTRYSRALQALTRHYYQIAIGSDTIAGSFVTTNAPTGITRNDTRFDRLRPGEYNFPSMNWVSKTTKYIDPFTGLALRRATGPGDLIPRSPTGLTFSDFIAGGAAWTPTGVTAAAYSGTSQAALYMRAATPSPAQTINQSFDSAQLVVTLSGSTPSVNVCLTNDGVTCSGKTINQAITGTATSYTIGTTTPILDAWRNSPVYPSSMLDLIPLTGNLTKAGATLTWASGGLFSPKLAHGSRITLGSTDCLISSLTNQNAIVLQSAGCVADGSYAFTIRNWGFLVSAGSNVNGAIALSSATWSNTTTGTATMGTYGVPQMCSPVKVTGPSGPGQVCSTNFVYDQYGTGNALVFFGDDGTTNILGLHYANPTGSGLTGGTCASGTEGVVWDRIVAGKYYCIGTLASNGATVIYSITYAGNYSTHVPSLDEYNPNSTITVESAGLNALVSAFTANDTPKFSDFSCASGWLIVGRQTDDLVMKCFQHAQDSPTWLAIYHIPNGTIIGAITTFGGPAGSANRWGDSHSMGLVDGTTWTFGTNNPTQDANYDSAITSGTLLATGLVACPSNTIQPEQAGVVNCNTVTLASITPTSGGTSLFGQTWLPGDYGLVTSGGASDVELVRMLTISGTTVVVLRNQKTFLLGSFMAHSGTLGLRTYPSVIKEMWWNYGDDPHGVTIRKPYGLTVLEDPQSTNCHQIFGSSVFILGCSKFTDYLSGFYMRVADLPTGNITTPNNFTTAPIKGNPDATFSASSYFISTSFNESHPSMTQSTATVREKQQWFDGRPYLADPAISTAGNISSIGTYTWKLAASATSNMQYRKQGFLVMTGQLPLVDVSPAVIADTAADGFKYCVVVIAGDCHAASVTGEVYFNVPFLTNAAVTPMRFVVYPANSLRDIAITQNTHTVGTLIQGSSTHHDFYGRNVRRLTTAFAPMKVQSVFWNLRAVPDASKFYWQTTQLDGVRNELMIADLPPFPTEESTYRGDFVPIQLSLGGVTGDTVRVRFGYAENGPGANLFCHERQIACSTDATGAQPYLWTDEPQQWTACDNGCKVKIPVISGRVAYYVVDRRNAAATVSSTIEAIAVP